MSDLRAEREAEDMGGYATSPCGGSK
jgi:hypothetical protein